jgi:hypothetical protein
MTYLMVPVAAAADGAGAADDPASVVAGDVALLPHATVASATQASSATPRRLVWMRVIAEPPRPISR